MAPSSPRAAEAAGVALAFEAAVAGGIPIIKALREGLAGNRIERVYGILNGTCNYILTAMRESGREFARRSLAEARSWATPRPIPSFDIDGIDAAHKLAILASVAFGCAGRFRRCPHRGHPPRLAPTTSLRRRTRLRIKLLGVARRTERGVEQRVHPCMVAIGDADRPVEGVFNAVVAEGDFVGTHRRIEGRGAGGRPTASAVAADLCDLAPGMRMPAFAVPSGALARLPAGRGDGPSRRRLLLPADGGRQARRVGRRRRRARDRRCRWNRSPAHPAGPTSQCRVLMTTHHTTEARLCGVLATIGALDAVLELPRLIRIETL